MNFNLDLDQDLINAVSQIVEASCSAKKMEKEELVGGQKKLDKNGNGKLDADDFKKLRKEDTEELDELSKNTLGSYINKANREANTVSRFVGVGGEGGKSESEVKARKELSQHVTKRATGIAKAVGNLTKEETEELDELSKATLGSYVKKASDNSDTNRVLQVHQAGKMNQSKAHDKKFGAFDKVEYSKSAQTALKRQAGISKAVNKLTKEEFTLEDYSLEELEDFMLSEDFEELDEVSGELLGRYIQKARADARSKFAHGKELDAHPKVKKISDKLSDLYNRREYTKSGDSKHRYQIDKGHNDIETTKKKLDPNYPKSAERGGLRRSNNIEKASNKLRYGKLTNEQVYLEDYSLEELEDFMLSEDFEQLDELSKATLGSYINKAKKDAKSSLDILTNHSYPNSTKDQHVSSIAKRADGIHTANKKISDKAQVDRLNKKPEIHPAWLNKEEVEELDELSKATLGNYVKHAARDQAHKSSMAQVYSQHDLWKTILMDRIANKRKAGIDKAVNKLTKEQVEELDELSKKTLGSYIKKAGDDRVSRTLDYGQGMYGNNSGAAAQKIINRGIKIDKAVNKLTKEQVEEIEALVAKHGLSEAVIEESAELSSGAKNALVHASNHKVGSDEYHKWMAVHHSHAARSGKQVDQAHHSFEAEHHFGHIAADTKAGEDFHNGDSHHWNV